MIIAAATLPIGSNFFLLVVADIICVCADIFALAFVVRTFKQNDRFLRLLASIAAAAAIVSTMLATTLLVIGVVLVVAK